MGRELASRDLDDLERTPAHAPEMKAASLPSFKRLPPHRRADQRRGASAGDPPSQAQPMPPRQAMRVPEPTRMRVPQPAPRPVPKPPWIDAPEPAPMMAPMPLTQSMRVAAMRMMEQMPRTPKRRLPWRAAALLLLGAMLGAAAALALPGTPPEGGTVAVTKYLTVLPPAAPAAPPPQIVHVDRWQIVAPEPRLMQPYEVLPPAMPAPPPPQIVMIERAGAIVAPRHVAQSKRSPAQPARTEAKARAPKPEPEQRDVAKELEQWLSGASDRR